MRRAKIISLVSVLIALYGATANADLVNGGFETGDFTGWTFSGVNPRPLLPGDPAPVADELGKAFLGSWTPTEGDYFASLWSTDTGGTDVSRMSQTFTTTQDGLVLEFDYFFDFGDWGFCDTATATLSGPAGDVSLFAHNTIIGGADDNTLADFSSVGWIPVSVDLPTAGDYTLTFETTDLAGVFESYLGVDNVKVVPLPAALLLGGLGLGFAGSLLGRFRRGRGA